MIFIYGIFGFLANISLIANLFIIVSLLGTIGATLTLPGIAGIVLTIGMAVDGFQELVPGLLHGLKKGIEYQAKTGLGLPINFD